MAVRYETGGGRATITIDDPEHEVGDLGGPRDLVTVRVPDGGDATDGGTCCVFSTSWSIGGATPEGFAADLVADGSARWITPAEVIDSAR
jgi:hypothetical protein